MASLNRAILAIEDAGDHSNQAFDDGMIQDHQLAFTLSLQIAQDELQRLLSQDPSGEFINCGLFHGYQANHEGCRLIADANRRLTQMRSSGARIFEQLNWGLLRQAAQSMAQSDAAAADARRHLYQAQEFYVEHIQSDLMSSSERNLRLAILSLLGFVAFITFGLQLVLQSRRQQRELGERDKANREHTRKLESIGREVRRLRDLGAAIDATAGVLIFNEQHKVVSMNDSFRRMRGLEKMDIKGQSILSILGLDDAELVESILASVADKKMWRGEVPSLREDGEAIWMYVLFYPELDELKDFEGSLALVLDITESKRAQLTLDRTRNLTALGEMAGGIAHEINNPLSVIMGRVSVLLKKLQSQNLDPAFLQSGLDQIHRTVSRIARIVDSMRRLARADVGQEPARPEKIEAILRETLEFTEDKLKKYDVTVTVTVQDDQGLGECSILLSGFGVSQILINLINNAVDAIDSVPDGERWVRLELGRSYQGMLQIKVIDSGKGIPVAIRGKIMDPFFTTKVAGKGTGIGLSLSLRLAEEHGGRLYLDGDAAHTTFVLELPEYQENKEVA